MRAITILPILLLLAASMAQAVWVPERPIPETIPAIEIDLRDEGHTPGISYAKHWPIDGYRSYCDESTGYWYHPWNSWDWVSSSSDYTPGSFSSQTYTHETELGTYKIKFWSLSYTVETTQRPGMLDGEERCTGPRHLEALYASTVGWFDYEPAPGLPATPMDFQVHFPEQLHFPGVKLYNFSNPYAPGQFLWRGSAVNSCFYHTEDVHPVYWDNGPQDPTQNTSRHPAFYPVGSRQLGTCDYPINPAGTPPWPELKTGVPIFNVQFSQTYCPENFPYGEAPQGEGSDLWCGPVYFDPAERVLEFRVLHGETPFAWRIIL